MKYSIIKIATIIILPITIIVVFFLMPEVKHLSSGKILFFHVPSAWIAVVAFISAGIFSTLYIINNKQHIHQYPRKAYIAAKLGVIFTILATISGAIWAKIEWNSYWNGDIRQKTILILLLFYFAYLSLYNLIDDEQKREIIGSVYLVFVMVIMPFFMFILPRSTANTLHPDAIIDSTNRGTMNNTIIIGLLLSIISFTLLFILLFQSYYKKYYAKPGDNNT